MDGYVLLHLAPADPHVERCFRTLIDSTPGVLIAWDIFGKQYGFDGLAASHAAHGRRLADTLGEWCKITDPKILAVRILAFYEGENKY